MRELAWQIGAQSGFVQRRCSEHHILNMPFGQMQIRNRPTMTSLGSLAVSPSCRRMSGEVAEDGNCTLDQ